LVKQEQGTHRSAKESIKLTTPNRNELEYITKAVVITKGAANHMKLNQFGASQGPEVLVVNEFSDIFFEGLSVMPLDRDIEFVIVYLKLLLYVRNPIGWLLSN
jgi:pyridoxal/pyridoxine/pyridoxamine kinase